MAKIPIYNRQVGLTTEAPAPKINASELGQVGQAIANTGEQITQVAQTIKKARQDEQETRGVLEGKKRFDEVMLKAQEDPNISFNEQLHNDELNQAKQETLKLVSDRDAYNNVSARLDMYMGDAQLKLKQFSYQKIVSDRLITLDNMKQDATERYANSYDKNEQQKIYDEMVSEFAKARDTKIITPKNYADNVGKLKSDFEKAKLDNDIAKEEALRAQDSYVLSELKKGKKGIYAETPEKDRNDAIESVEKKIIRNQSTMKFTIEQDKDKNESDMLLSNPTESQIKEALSTQKIRLSFGEKMLKKLYDVPATSTDYMAYNEIRDMQTKGASVKNINQMIVDNSDKITEQDKKSLIDKSTTELDKKQKMTIQYNAEAIKGWAKNNLSIIPEVSADMVYDFYKKVDSENAQGKRIDEIAQEVIKNKIKTIYPETSLLEDMPNFVADRKRIRRVLEKQSNLKVKTPKRLINPTLDESVIDFDDL